jgi:precorrin-4 methylase
MARFVPRIRELMAAGKTVVLADAGDPTIFGPWSWVTETFADLGPEIIPGLSSFSAANAALKRNLTCDVGSILLTAGDDLGSPDEHGRLRTTLVIFTHHLQVQELVPRLAARYPADTPVALVCEASYPTEEVIPGTLATILEKLSQRKVPHLYLLYVGDTVGPMVSESDKSSSPGKAAGEGKPHHLAE